MHDFWIYMSGMVSGATIVFTGVLIFCDGGDRD